MQFLRWWTPLSMYCKLIHKHIHSECVLVLNEDRTNEEENKRLIQNDLFLLSICLIQNLLCMLNTISFDYHAFVEIICILKCGFFSYSPKQKKSNYFCKIFVLLKLDTSFERLHKTLCLADGQVDRRRKEDIPPFENPNHWQKQVR